MRNFTTDALPSSGHPERSEGTMYFVDREIKKGGRVRPPSETTNRCFYKRSDCVNLKLTADSAGSVISRLPVKSRSRRSCACTGQTRR